jgi:cysteine desulfurase
MASPKSIYLDNAAATPVDDRVMKAMQPYWQDQFYNPSAGYLAAKQVRSQLKNWRQRAANILGVKPNEIVFTAGGSEADNLAIHGIMRRFPQAKQVVSAVEHPAILQAAKIYQHHLAPVTIRGLVDTDKLVKLIDDQTVLVSIMQANNEVGTLQPLARISALINQIRHQRLLAGNNLPLYLHSDASQSPNCLAVKPHRLGLDLMTINGGKIYGPKQSGLLFVKSGIELVPLVYGGGQERGRRSGTESLAAIAGLTTALEIAQEQRSAEAGRLQALQQLFETQVIQAIPEAVINSRGPRLPSFVHLTIPGQDNEQLMMHLDEQGIICAVGSACSASNQAPSHVLKAMGLSDKQAQSSLRFSMGRGTTQADIQKVVKTLARLVRQNQG